MDLATAPRWLYGIVPEILCLVALLAINLLADLPPAHEVNTLIYAVPIVPFVLMAAVFK